MLDNTLETEEARACPLFVYHQPTNLPLDEK
jgi:hypothetical protein